MRAGQAVIIHVALCEPVAITPCRCVPGAGPTLAPPIMLPDSGMAQIIGSRGHHCACTFSPYKGSGQLCMTPQPGDTHPASFHFMLCPEPCRCPLLWFWKKSWQQCPSGEHRVHLPAGGKVRPALIRLPLASPTSSLMEAPLAKTLALLNYQQLPKLPH